MPRIPFAEYAPDISDNESSVSHDITNCLPQGDGYGPVNVQGYIGVVSAPTNVLPAACRGFFSAKNTDGTFSLFAGTSTKLYFWNTGLASWQDYSFLKGGISTSTTTAPLITNAGTLSATSTTTAQTFTAVPVTGGSGSGAQASVQVSSFGSATPGVTLIDITTVGSNYLTGDSISCASSNIGGVTGFSANVVALSSGATVQSYAAVPSAGFWRFTQYNQTVIAVNGNNVPQQFLLGGSFTNFGPLAGSPPKANYVTAIAGFLMLSGLPSHLSRIQWSDLDNITQWTPGVGQSDFQDLTDGGNASNLAGFDLYGCVFQDECVRLLTYVGGNIVFQITKIAGGTGNSLLQPYAMCIANNMIFWASPEGFKMIQPGAGGPKFIGKERVDRTYLNAVNNALGGFRYWAQACEDPQGPRVYFTDSNASGFSNIYCYDYELDKWTKIVVTGTIIAPYQNNGFSGSIVPQTVGFTNSVGTTFATLNTSSPGDVTLETAEQGTDARRIFVRGFRPITDASEVLGSASFRDIPLASQFGPINTVTVTASGSGTSTGGIITGVALAGGSGSGAIASVTVTSGGGITVTSPAGSAASNVTLTSNGSNYLITSIYSLSVVGSGLTTGVSSGVYATTFTALSSGTGAAANLSIDNNGRATVSSITARGSGYSPSDTLTSVSTTTGIGGLQFTPLLGDTTQLTASSSVTGVSGAAFEVDTIITYPYLAEQVAHPITGMIPLRKDSRYMRAKIRIPSAATWTYAKGVEPDGSLGGLR